MYFYLGQANPLDFSRMDLPDLSPDVNIDNFEQNELDQYLPVANNPNINTPMRGVLPPYSPSGNSSCSSWMSPYHQNPPTLQPHPRMNNTTSSSSSGSPDPQSLSPSGTTQGPSALNPDYHDMSTSHHSPSGVKLESSSSAYGGYTLPYRDPNCEDLSYAQADASQYYAGSGYGTAQQPTYQCMGAGLRTLYHMATTGPSNVSGSAAVGQWDRYCRQ